MRTMKGLLLVLLALTLGLTAAPAAAQNERDEGFQRVNHERWEARERHGRREHERWGHRHWGHRHWGHRHFGFAFPAPYAAPCYWRTGYWAWNGWQYVWVPARTVCY